MGKVFNLPIVGDLRPGLRRSNLMWAKILLFCAECCIFHKQRPFGEWSDDDSDNECENDCDNCEEPAQ